MAEGGGGGPQISFKFQVGLTKDRVVVDSIDLTLKSIKTLACDFINEKFPEHGISRLAERLMVFRHDYTATNALQMVNSVTEVTEGCILEVVLNTAPLGDEEVEIRPHSLSIHSYKTPTFCSFCGEMLFGMFKQGLKCEYCGLNFHKRCVFKIPNDCSGKLKKRVAGVDSITSRQSVDSRQSIESTHLTVPSPREGSVSPQSQKRSMSGTPSGRPAWVDRQMATRVKIPHTFVLHTYTKPTKCNFCNKVLVGVFKQGVRCKDCGYNAHKKCAERVPKDCTGEAPDLGPPDGATPEGSSEGDEHNGEESDEEGKVQSHSPDGDIVTPGNFDKHMEAQPTHSNIPVQRLVQSVKQTKRVGSKTIKEGWMVHFTNKDIMKKRHYWRLDSKSITMFKSETGPNYYKEVPLSEILAVDSAKTHSGEVATHCFEIRTANVDFFVGEDTTVPQSDGASSENSETSWENAIKQAFKPVQSRSSPDVVTVTPPNKEEKEKEKEEGKETDISQAYQIFPDEVLGSGQFGIVYGGVHRISSRSVAIKVIDKMRFPTKQEAALKNEVSILQNLHYPGVVNLERMFETPERIFVVMEKLKGDMLEMILSSEQGRLSERITKFLVTQILVALKHLHSKNIVHCDLKPENVLLSSDSDFPQVKLCDFGYARIIGKKSFRKSIVGTPAYLAPEVLYSNVLKKRGFNRSLDMWSTGVIIYVALSGQFPFNEDVDIEDQIKNAQFMYPTRPWKSISKEAVNCIQNLLVVEHEARYTVDDALQDLWVSDQQCKNDILRLEEEVGETWLTPVVQRRLSTYEHQHL